MATLEDDVLNILIRYDSDVVLLKPLTSILQQKYPEIYDDKKKYSSQLELQGKIIETLSKRIDVEKISVVAGSNLGFGFVEIGYKIIPKNLFLEE